MIYIICTALLDTSSSLRDSYATNAVNLTHRQDRRLKQTVFKQRAGDILTNGKYRIIHNIPVNYSQLLEMCLQILN